MVSWLSPPVSCLLNSHTELLAGNRWDKFLRSTSTGALPCQLLNSPPPRLEEVEEEEAWQGLSPRG